MNVNVVVSTLLVGGAEKQAILLANSIAVSHSVTIVVLNGHLIEQKMLDRISSACRLKCLSGRWPVRLVAFYRQMRKCDIAFSYLAFANFLSCIVGRFAGTRRIYTGIRNTNLPKHKAMVERLLLKWFATAAVFNSCAAKEELLGRASNGVVIWNCIEKPPRPVQRPFRKSIRIVSVGRFVPQKDYSCALRAMEALREAGVCFEYVVVGYGPLEQDIVKTARTLGIEQHVTICRNPPDVGAVLRESDIYLCTSRYEGLSNAVMEGMAAGLPVVATDVGDNRVLVRQNENGFLHRPGDFGAICASLAALASDYSLRQRYGRRSWEIIAEEFGEERFKRAYQELVR